ncbi:MAG TPA: DHHA1 domain-containing protein, partial [Alphaproteobacteria bacterium]|nr:DHHA1 domain-containing protein [Alphaproteobacteria bacterium]
LSAVDQTKTVKVEEVADGESDRILHLVSESLPVGAAVRGEIDSARRQDHMQQHSGQHVLSAAFIELFKMPTVSFHMGEESCTIDLDAAGLNSGQAEKAEQLANQIVLEDRPVAIRFVSLEEARASGVRKLPPRQTGELRLIEIKDFDLTACGGTHVRATGQIGSILLRKIEKVKQGVRVEFVCGLRAVRTARRDFTTLTEAASLYSSHIYDVPQQVRKSLEEAKSSSKARHKLLEELAEFQAESMLAKVAGSPRVVTAVFPDRDAVFIKLLAQKLTGGKADVVALLAACAGQTTLVFAQSPGLKSNMGLLLKETLSQLGGRGGGTADLAQGGLPGEGSDPKEIDLLLKSVAPRI